MNEQWPDRRARFLAGLHDVEDITCSACRHYAHKAGECVAACDCTQPLSQQVERWDREHRRGDQGGRR